MDQYKGFCISLLIEGEEKTLSFPEGFTRIGDSPEGPGAFPLPGRGLKKEALSLIRSGDEIIAHNVANDPFCLIDGEPFFKKKIASGARITIRHLELVLHSLQNEPARKSVPPIQEPISHKKEEIASELKEKEAATPKGEFQEELESEEPLCSLRIREAKEIPKSWDYPHVSSKREIPWKSFLSFSIATFLFVGAIVGFEHYLRLYGESEQEELRAATLLSDIAMAIASAQLYHITPERHDWSDPEFLQKNLIALLENPPKLSSDESGLFIGPFHIRVYTSQDLSRFLLIATPSPSPLQWLIPKKSLAIDSNTMSIRKLTDVKTLNRLLAPMTTLDGANNYLVNKHLSHGEIIPLQELAKNLNQSDFAPPTLGAYLRPGSENLIYNAPRYRAFGQAILEKGLHFTSVITSSHEMLMLRSELEVLQKFPHFILYTESPLQEAKLAFNTLKRISPDNDFILARVFTDKSRTIKSIEIILDTSIEEEMDLPPLAPRILLSQSLSITPPFGEFNPRFLGYENQNEEIAFSITDPKEQLQTRFEYFLENPSDEILEKLLEELSAFHKPQSSYDEEFWNQTIFHNKKNTAPFLPSSKKKPFNIILSK